MPDLHSEVLYRVYENRRKATRPSLVSCGDDSSSKGIAAELIRGVGFDPWTLEPHGSPRYTEPFALLTAQAYVTHYEPGNAEHNEGDRARSFRRS